MRGCERAAAARSENGQRTTTIRSTGQTTDRSIFHLAHVLQVRGPPEVQVAACSAAPLTIASPNHGPAAVRRGRQARPDPQPT